MANSTAKSRRKPAGANTALSERAHQAITGLIHRHELRGGTVIVESKLAEQLNISRTPLREALQRLEGEGLLMKNSGRSFIVRHVDLTEYLQSLKVREILEGEAAMLAAGRAPAERIAETRREIEALKSVSLEHTAEHWRSDDNVHMLLSDHCGNAVMARQIVHLRMTTRLFEVARVAERVHPDSREHLAILDALDSGDGRKARKAVSDHIRSVIASSLVDLS